MKISDWLLTHYKKRFGEFQILDHMTGPTYNDGGAWNTTIVQIGDEILKIHMPTDYRCDDLQVTKMKVSMRKVYEPA